MRYPGIPTLGIAICSYIMYMCVCVCVFVNINSKQDLWKNHPIYDSSLKMDMKESRLVITQNRIE